MLSSSRVALNASRAVALPTRGALAGGYGSTIRTYAQAAPSSAATKPPVALFGIDGTYASALVRRPSPSPYCPAPSLIPDPLNP